jgi:cytochrome c oxidase cbb3-type subunit III
MRTDRPSHLRGLLLLLVAVTAAPVLAQASAPATTGEPLFEVSNMLNYAMLALATVQTVFILSLAGIMRTMGGSRAWAKRFAEQKSRAALAIPFALLLSTQASAQAYQEQSNSMTNYDLFWLLLGVNVFLFVILLVQVNITRKMVSTIANKPEEVRGAAQVKAPSWVDNLMKRLTRQVEIEKEQDVLMHHEYDGIRELDNVLPPWWVWLFYGSIIWSVVYLVNVHVIDIWPDQKTEYTNEMAQAKADVDAYMATLTNTVDENNVTVLTDPGALANGASLFTQFCTPCHGADAAGSETSVGPNLTDAYWIHGGGVKNIFKTIKYGVAEKGMISWKAQLQPAEMAALASYILNLQGSGSPAQKAPQGELWTEPAAAADSTATIADSTAAPVDTVRLAVN